jgi:predicted RNA-binding protein associated with RNAse of E/G family
MELRNNSRDGYVDEIIFTARLPAELLEDDQFETMDTDGDGVITREEFEAAQQSNSLEEE